MFSNSGYVMTLANGIIGVGILAMPFCFQKCGIILSIFLLILSNFITRICCHYLNKSSLLTRRKSFELLGFHAFGTSGKLLVELCIIGYLLGTCITYFVVVGDLGPQIITKMFALENDHRHLRTLLMCGVTLLCIIPLGMLKNVDSLSTVCTASIGFYVCLVVKIVMESRTHIMANDWRDNVVYWQPAGVLQCLPIFSMALSCQMQLFEVFTSINNQSLEKLNGIVRNATWICTFVYIAVGFFGYVAFCTQTFSGNILINLSPSFGSDVIKIGFILSVAFSFPLVIFPCRASLYSLLYRKGQMDVSSYIPENRFRAITVFIVVFSLCVALMIPSVELIIGLVGSTIGVAICIMFPAACFRKIIRKETTERSLAQFIVISGFCLMILGTYANLSAIDEKSSGAHLELTKIDESLIKPTELPKNPIDEKIKTIQLAMEKQFVKDKEKESSPPVQDVKTKAKIMNLNYTQGSFGINKKPSPPPLPVDESHSSNEVKMNNQQDRKPDTNENLSPNLKASNDPPPKEKMLNISQIPLNQMENNKQLPLEKNANIKKTTSHVDGIQQQQTIDTDAIRNDEEIAKEEMKLQTKQETDELKKTKEELEKTKDLLEKKVEELKEELVKQNQETQNLVAEKLGEVVEKFEQIERKVQQREEDIQAPLPSPIQIERKVEQKKQEQEQEQDIKAPPQPPAQTIKETPKGDVNVNETINDRPSQKGSLISILTDNRNFSNQNVNKNESVYEPLSYKTGELIEHARNASGLDKRLPLPLALLINASQANRTDNIKNAYEIKETKKKMENNPELMITNHTKQLNISKTTKINAEETKIITKDKESINMVASIGRDLLELHEKPEETTITTDTLHEIKKKDLHRIKRSSEYHDENCLTEPKIENILAAGLTGSIQMKIGRDLKFLKNPDYN